MAQMYPAALSDDDFHSRAERKLHAALADQLDDDWDVYHSLSWLRRKGENGYWEGEIDFVLSHPEAGFLCIEAKGGDVSFRDGRWHRKERGNWVPYSKDPFDQAQDQRHALRRLIREQAQGDEALLIGHAVSFPEVPVAPNALPPKAPRQIVIDRNDVERIEPAIRRAVAFFKDSLQPPGARGMRMLRECLVPTVEIEVPLAERFLEEEEQLIRLTREQTLLLRRFSRARRMAISGCAGSGKTMLAVEQAKWLKREKGLEVAFVCFNRQLADHLKQREGGSGVEFHTFHGLCTWWGHRAPGVEVPSYSGDPPQEYWQSELPEVLMEAASELGGAYDALMVDEAQDLHSDWLTALMYTLTDERASYVWLFLDSNQRVYDVRLEVPAEFVPFDLPVNCRNTQAIHREVMKLYRGEVAPEAMGPEGRAIELIHASDQAAAVAGVVQRICGEEKVPPQDVVVLSAHGFERSEVAKSPPPGYRYVKKRATTGKSIQLSSIRAFKGLESKVVILCELEDLDEETRTAQLYVGMSRAVNHCVVVAPPAAG